LKRGGVGGGVRVGFTNWTKAYLVSRSIGRIQSREKGGNDYGPVLTPDFVDQVAQLVYDTAPFLRAYLVELIFMSQSLVLFGFAPPD
jgi:hypothetical protein